MCGICGIYNEKNLATVTAMLNSIRHRGPDYFNTVIFGNHSLGECGLNIVSGRNDSPLPLIDSDGDIALLFNGEIYNYQEIKKELINDGHTFVSDTDSEIIIPLYKKYKEDFLKFLKGMFAIVIIEQNRILLARDKFGIKPLYYYRINNRLIFGSEIKSLLQHTDVPTTLNQKSLEELLVFGYTFSDEHTLLKDIYQIPSGVFILFDGDRIKKQKYYKIPSSFYLKDQGISKYSYQDNRNYEESVNKLQSLLVTSFELLYNHGNFEKGIYLSGGLDSTLMAVLFTEILGRPIKTYTLYDSEDAPDSEYSQKVARAISSKHYNLYTTPKDFLQELPSFVYHYENLIAGGVFDIQGGIAFQIISKFISKYHKAAFSGEGADELFGGYYWVYTHPLGFSDRIRERVSRLPDKTTLRELVETIFPEPENESIYRKNLFDILMKSGLANYHLWSVDRSCSSFGFETRPPYLYDDLAEFALSLPIDYKVPTNLVTKKILKDAALPFLRKYNLVDIINRKKCGMPSALEKVMPRIRNELSNLIGDDTMRRHPFRQYLSNTLDVLTFDLFYYFIIHKRGQYDINFSINEFYKRKINETMYHQ